MKPVARASGTVALSQPEAPEPLAGRKPKKSLLTTLRRAVVRVILPFGKSIPDNAVMPPEAVKSFLGAMAAAAARTYGLWHQKFESGLADYLDADARKDFFIRYPVEDYYFAGVVALEAAKLRQIYTPMEAAELLAEIGDQVDHAGGRDDRTISEMLFEVIGQIELSSGPTQQKMPYDKVTKSILKHLDIHRNETTRELITDKAFRHALGEPLAIGVQNWWQAFQAKFVLYIPPEPEPEEPEQMPQTSAAPQPARRRRPMKRAASLI